MAFIVSGFYFSVQCFSNWKAPRNFQVISIYFLSIFLISVVFYPISVLVLARFSTFFSSLFFGCMHSKAKRVGGDLCLFVDCLQYFLVQLQFEKEICRTFLFFCLSFLFFCLSFKKICRSFFSFLLSIFFAFFRFIYLAIITYKKNLSFMEILRLK